MSETEHDSSTTNLLPQKFLWLADAPAYIDADEVEAFYDATVRPYMRKGVTTRASASQHAGQVATAIGLEATVDSGKLIETLSAWLPKLSAKGTVGLNGEMSHASESSTQIEWHPITTPQRQLEQLALHYYLYQENRLLMVALKDLTKSCEKDWIRDLPRGFVLLEIPPGTKLIPTYAEYGNESTSIRLFNKIYPEIQAYKCSASIDERRRYWEEIGESFDLQKSLQAVEDEPGNIQVIDFRVLIDHSGETLHLHFSPRGRYPKITFAYNLIRRAYHHGIRLVGTLRTEPGMKVLAIYES